MKKLKLNLQQFEGAEVLTRSQLKQIMGGEGGSGGDGAACENDSDCKKFGQNCYCLTKIKKCGCIS